jgi:hypothetical protein
VAAVAGFGEYWLDLAREIDVVSRLQWLNCEDKNPGQNYNPQQFSHKFSCRTSYQNRTCALILIRWGQFPAGQVLMQRHGEYGSSGCIQTMTRIGRDPGARGAQLQVKVAVVGFDHNPPEVALQRERLRLLRIDWAGYSAERRTGEPWPESGSKIALLDAVGARLDAAPLFRQKYSVACLNFAVPEMRMEHFHKTVVLRHLANCLEIHSIVIARRR